MEDIILSCVCDFVYFYSFIRPGKNFSKGYCFQLCP